MTPNDRALADRLQHMNTLILIGFLLLTLAVAYWAVIRSEVLAGRDDNPRVVEAELRLDRGAILDRDGNLLAESLATNGRYERVYWAPEAAPVIGYYSVRYGTDGIENSMDTVLRGSDRPLWQQAAGEWLHSAVRGRLVQLTLDGELQRAASALMNGHTGGLVLLELGEDSQMPTAEIRALVTQPGYDPNTLDDAFEQLVAESPGRLFNRATQGQYPAGATALPLMAGAAVDDGLVAWDDVAQDANGPVVVDGRVHRCQIAAGINESAALPWREIAGRLCPGPVAGLAAVAGAATVAGWLEASGLATPPDVTLPVAESDLQITDAGLTAVGLDQLAVSPLQVALAWSTVANGGLRPALHVVEAVQTLDGEWQPMDDVAAAAAPVYSEGTARSLIAEMSDYGDVAELSTTVVQDESGSQTAWYIGIAPAGAPQFVVVVALENSPATTEATIIGRSLLALASDG